MQLELSTRAEVASEVQGGSAWRAVFSFPVVLGALLVLLMVFTTRSRFSDPDLWWHLKTGQIVWNTHSIPRIDLFSFTAYGHPWTAQEWLSQTGIYGAYKLGGYPGLMLWLCSTSSLLVLGAFVLCTLYSGNCKVAFLGGVITWLFATVGLAVRPHIVGYLLLIGELLIVHLGRSRNGRWYLALPPLFALWVNCHSSFVLGLIVLAVVLFCSMLEFQLGLLVSHRSRMRERRTLAIASGLSLVALFLNPIGPKLIWYPFDVLLKQHVGLNSVSEWQQPSFERPKGLRAAGGCRPDSPASYASPAAVDSAGTDSAGAGIRIRRPPRTNGICVRHSGGTHSVPSAGHRLGAV